jgi:hypothetical protein
MVVARKRLTFKHLLATTTALQVVFKVRYTNYIILYPIPICQTFVSRVLPRLRWCVFYTFDFKTLPVGF